MPRGASLSASWTPDRCSFSSQAGTEIRGNSAAKRTRPNSPCNRGKLKLFRRNSTGGYPRQNAGGNAAFY